MNSITVVRSLHSDRAAEQVRAATAARDAALAMVEAFTDERFPELTARANFGFDGSFSVVGFVATDGSTAEIEVPPGMRYDKGRKMLAPAKRTPDGKALAREMADLDFDYPLIDGIGGIAHGYKDGPDVPEHERRGYFTGWAFHVLDRADGSTEVYATVPVGYLGVRDQRTIDSGDAWEPARLSELTAAIEEHAARLEVSA